MNIGKVIKAITKEVLQMNIYEVAELAGISQSTISMWIMGSSQPQPAYLQKIADVLGYPPVFFQLLTTEKQHLNLPPDQDRDQAYRQFVLDTVKYFEHDPSKIATIIRVVTTQ